MAGRRCVLLLECMVLAKPARRGPGYPSLGTPPGTRLTQRNFKPLFILNFMEDSMRNMLKTSALCAALGLAPFAVDAETYTWDGTTNTDWFGANWTTGGGAGQTAPDEFTSSGNAKIFDYYNSATEEISNGQDIFNVGPGANITNFIDTDPFFGSGMPYFHDDSQVTINQASVHLYANTFLPTKVLDSSVMTITDSTVRFTRGANPGNAFVIGDTASVGSAPSVSISGTSMTVDQFDSNNSTDEGGDFQMFASGTFGMTNNSSLSVSRTWQIDDQSQATVTDSSVNTRDLDLFDDATLTLNNADVTITGEWDVNNSSMVTITGNTQIDAVYIRIDNNNAGVSFESGHIDFQDGNVLRGSSGFDGDFDFVGNPGEVTITQNGVTSTGNNLAFKLYQGFFSIDGDRINPNGDGYGAFDGTDITGLNAWLAGDVVNGKYFQLTGSTDGTGDITLNLVPEPSSLALLALGGLAVCGRRRRPAC